ncbi:MAG: acylphosphatase [Candidatus Aminicenantia bacterium]
MKKRFHLIVSGRVQGVFFRDFTRRQAYNFNVKGWVRNLTDGSVEIVAEGEEEDLLKFLEEVKKGPPLAIVEDVDIEWMDYREEFSDFRIKF